MSCELTKLQLHAYLDDELDAAGTMSFESHMKSCPECQSALTNEETLRRAITQADLYAAAPAGLRQKIMAQLPANSPASSSQPVSLSARWRWLAVAACLLLGAVLGWRIISQRSTPGAPETLIAAAVDAHLRSLQPGHLADVPSTDKHTVKPWFDGRLDFAPPVPDLSSEGFPLIGGRLDVLHGRAVAALVYGRRSHVMNVFVWRDMAPEAPAQSGQRQGYQWVAWQKDGFSFCAVSDTAPEDLQQLMQLFLKN
jgi:anti-sigma factor (TIGR02949 family)